MEQKYNALQRKYMKVKEPIVELTPLQEEYLSGIEIRSPITKRDPRYHIAKELEKKGLLKLIESGTPLIGMVLTNAGKEHIKTRKEINTETK